MAMTPKNRLRKALAELAEPGTDRKLKDSDLVRDLHVHLDGSAVVEVALKTPNYPHQAELEAAMQQAAKQVEGIQSLEVKWGLSPDGRHVTSDDALPDVKNVILVMSGKGGVGKSTVAVNVAVALRQMGAAVGLLDADIHGPSIPTMLGDVGPLTSDGKRILPPERFGVRLMSIGYLLEDSKTAVIWRGPMLHGALVQFLRDVAWGKLDYLLLDLPPGTGDIALTLSQRVHCNGAVIVTTPQNVALQDVFKSVSMCQKLGIAVLGVVENQSYFVCEHGQRYELFGSGGGEQVARLAEAPLLGKVPVDPVICAAGDSGTPLVESSPDCPSAQAFASVARALAQSVSEQNAKDGGRLGTMHDDQGRPHLPVMR